MLLVVLCCLASTPASAITTVQSGPYVDAGAVGALGFGPASAAGGWTASSGVWLGQYDDVYALGKYTSLGVAASGIYGSNGLRHQGLIEIRRGMDLLLGGPFLSLSGGGSYAKDGMSPAVQVGLGAKKRRTPHTGWLIKLDFTANQLNHTPQYSLGLTIAGAYSRPSH